MMCVTYYDIYSCDAMMFVRYLTHDVTTVIRVAPASVLRALLWCSIRGTEKGKGCPVLLSHAARLPAVIFFGEYFAEATSSSLTIASIDVLQRILLRSVYGLCVRL